MNVAICTKLFEIEISEICVQLNSNSVPHLDFYSLPYQEEKITFLVEHVVLALAAALLFGGILMVSPLSRAGRRASPCGQQRGFALAGFSILVCRELATRGFLSGVEAGKEKDAWQPFPRSTQPCCFSFIRRYLSRMACDTWAQNIFAFPNIHTHFCQFLTNCKNLPLV